MRKRQTRPLALLLCLLLCLSLCPSAAHADEPAAADDAPDGLQFEIPPDRDALDRAALPEAEMPIALSGEPERVLDEAAYDGPRFLIGSGAAWSLTWRLYEDGELLITGNASMLNYNSGYAPWASLWEYITRITVGSGVTTIGNNAFYGLANVTEIALPEGLTSIGNNAFTLCDSLTELTVPEGVTSVGDGAFASCEALTTLALPSTLTSLGSDAFLGCISLREIRVAAGNASYSSRDGVLFNGDGTKLLRCPEGKSGAYQAPAGVTEVADGAFLLCEQLTAVTLSAGVVSVGQEAFAYCTRLTSLRLPASLTSIGQQAFAYCTQFQRFTLPASLTSLGSLAFFGCEKIASFGVASGNTAYVALNGVLFNADRTELLCFPMSKGGSYEIPSGVQSVSVGAFYGCTGLSAVSFPAGLLVVNGGAFYGCSGLQSVSLPEGLLAIGEEAFCGCTALQSIKLPTNNIYLYSGAFAHCSSLTSITLPEIEYQDNNYIFYGCTALKTITVQEYFRPRTCCFTGCDSLTDVYFGGDRKKRIDMEDACWDDGNNQSFFSAEWHYGKELEYTEISGFAELKALVENYPGRVYARFSGSEFVFEESLELQDELYFFADAPGTTVRIPEGVTVKTNSLYRRGFWADRLVVEGSLRGMPRSISYRTLIGTVDWYGNYVASGTFGVSGYLAWTVYDTGEMIINGTASMKEYDYARQPWAEYRDYVTKLTVNPGVPDISPNTFANFTALTSVSLPDSLTSIGAGAFSGCVSLTGVAIPSSVTSIGSGAFSCCDSLTGIQVAADNPAYSSRDGVLLDKAQTQLLCCPGGKTGVYVLPASVTGVDAYSFSGCTQLTGVEAAAEHPCYSSLDGVLFNKTQSELTCFPAGKTGSYQVPDGVTAIADRAFFGCAGLTELSLPVGLSGIGEGAFANCVGLRRVDGGVGLTALGREAFANCISLESVELPASLVRIGDRAFANCIELPALALPDGLTEIGEDAFENCVSLTSVELPAGVTGVGVRAFANCLALQSASLPASLTEIADETFLNCISLTSVELAPGLASVGGHAFENCLSLESLALPAGLTSIGDYAFKGCVSLSELSLPRGLESIGVRAFENCYSLLELKLPSGLTSIGNFAFASNINLRRVALPASLTSIGSYAFSNCTVIEAVNFGGTEAQRKERENRGWNGEYSPELFAAAWTYAPEPPTSYDGVLPAELETLEAEAFAGCAFTAVRLPDGLLSIGSLAFAGSKNLQFVYIPESVTEIAPDAFDQVENLTIIGVAGSEAEAFAEMLGYTFIEG